MRSPRDYQSRCIEAVCEFYRTGGKACAVELFTGAGKGFVQAAIAKMVQEKGGRVLVCVNRDNLCEQLFNSLVEQGLMPKMERGLDKASPMSNLVVGSIQSLQNDRLLKWARDHFKLVICDEVHFAAADTFKATLDHFAPAWHLGMSATVERHDKQGLWKGYEKVVFTMALMEGISEGWLVPFDFEELPVPINISDQQQKKKMWTEKDESNVFSTGNYLPRLFEEAAARVKDKHALFFWPNCDSSIEADKYFRAAGIESRHVEGPGGPANMKREQINELYEWFRTPGPKALHNADLLSYGADFPMIDCVGIMRISRSIPMLKQRLGRGTRPMAMVDNYATAELRRLAIAASVKPNCKILDLMLQLGEVQNRFADATMLITEDEAERRFLRKEMAESGKPMSMEDLKDKLKAKRETDREAQLAKLAEDAANAAERRKNNTSGKLLYVGDILQKYNPSHLPAKEWQVKELKSFGISIGDGPFSEWQMIQIKNRYRANRLKALNQRKAELV